MDLNTNNQQQDNFFKRTFATIKSYFSNSILDTSSNKEKLGVISDCQSYENQDQYSKPQRKLSMPSIDYKKSQLDYTQQQKPKKINPILGIAQYITNAKYNNNDSNQYTTDHTNSAFSMITHQSTYPILNQPKQIINYNDFSVSSELQPITLLNQKQQRDQDQEQPIHNDKFYMSFGNNSAFSNAKVNRKVNSYNKPKQHIINTKEEEQKNNKNPTESFEKLYKDIQQRKTNNDNYVNDLKEYNTITKGMFDYEDRKKYLNEYYSVKLIKLQERRNVLNISTSKHMFTDLTYGHGEEVIVEGKPRINNAEISQASSRLVREENQDNKKVKQSKPNQKMMFNISAANKDTNDQSQQKPNEIQENPQSKPKGSNLFNFGSFEGNGKEQTKNVFLCGDSIKSIGQSNEENQSIEVHEKKAISSVLFSPHKAPESKKHSNTTTSFFGNNSKSPSLFQVPKEKSDEYKDTKYESVILQNVTFGAPKESVLLIKNEQKEQDIIKDSFEENELSLNNKKLQGKKKRKDYSTETDHEKLLFNIKTNKEKHFLFETNQDKSESLFHSDKKIIFDNKDIEKEKSQTVSSSLFNIEKPKTQNLFQVPKEKIDEFKDNKYESVILSKVEFGAPQENKNTLFHSDKKLVINEELSKSKEPINLFKDSNIKFDDSKPIVSLFPNDNKSTINKNQSQPLPLFQIPKEKTDEFNDNKYESVILSKVLFGAPKDSNNPPIKKESPSVSLFTQNPNESKSHFPWSSESKSLFSVLDKEQTSPNLFTSNRNDKDNQTTGKSTSIFGSKSEPIGSIFKNDSKTSLFNNEPKNSLSLFNTTNEGKISSLFGTKPQDNARELFKGSSSLFDIKPKENFGGLLKEPSSLFGTKPTENFGGLFKEPSSLFDTKPSSLFNSKPQENFGGLFKESSSLFGKGNDKTLFPNQSTSLFGNSKSLFNDTTKGDKPLFSSNSLFGNDSKNK